MGADILGQLGQRDVLYGKFYEESVIVLLNMLEREQDQNVLRSITVALGHRHDPRAIQPLIQLKDHPDPDVRFGVVFGLSAHEDELAIQTLVELSTDEDSDVRDWATFGLGTQITTDTPTIREALFARLPDDDGDIRGEALVGLARRHDLRVIEPLLTYLEIDDAPGILDLEAAAEIGDQRLYPALVQLREKWKGDKDWPYSLLEEAIEKCQPRT